jgi:hypothetical protein
VVRKLLARLSKGFVRDEEMLDLNITINELQKPLAGVSSVAVNKMITDLFQTKDYQSGIRFLDAMGFQRKGYDASDYISSHLWCWTRNLAEEAGDHVEVLR